MAEKTLTLTSEELRERPDLCAIDGVLYDLKSLAKEHPGGDVIAAAGGADATPLFYSMHVGVKPEKSVLLKKFAVGKHELSSNDPVYEYDTPFAQDVKKSVKEVMKGKNLYAPPAFWARTALIIALVMVGEFFWATTGAIAWGIFTGYMHMQIGLSIQHDASHGALSKNPKINAFFAYGIDAIGSSRWIWLQSHIMRHHPYTNQHDLDMDAGSAEPFLLFHDYPAASTSRKWFHAFQAWYTHMVLGLYGVSMVYNPQYLFRMQHSETIPELTTAVHPEGFLRGYRAMAIFLRMFYIFRIAFLPWYLCGVSPLITLPLVPTATGAFLTFVFVLSHNFEGSERVPEKKCVVDQQGKVIDSEKQAPAQEGGDKIDWYRAQAETSSTYGGKIAMMMTGGLNLQIEHHLFPRMSSWHYPTIQQAVKDACARHGVRYAYYPTIQENIISTLRYMRKAGVAEALSHAQSELS